MDVTSKPQFSVTQDQVWTVFSPQKCWRCWNWSRGDRGRMRSIHSECRNWNVDPQTDLTKTKTDTTQLAICRSTNTPRGRLRASLLYCAVIARDSTTASKKALQLTALSGGSTIRRSRRRSASPTL